MSDPRYDPIRLRTKQDELIAQLTGVIADRDRLAAENERLRTMLANVLFDPRKFRAAAHALLASAGPPQVAE